MTTKTKTISKPQKIQIQLMRMSSFNEFNGDVVCDDLIKHRDLWKAFLWDREAYSAEHYRREIRDRGLGLKDDELPIAPIDTIRLRDLAAGYWNVDCLLILPEEGREQELYELADSPGWCADEIDWYSGLDAGEKMLRVWWD